MTDGIIMSLTIEVMVIESYINGAWGAGYHYRNIIERNSIHHSGISVRSNGVALVMLGQSKDILRYNDMFAGGLSSVYINVKPMQYAIGNHIYNNTIFANGYGDNTFYSNSSLRAGIFIYHRTTEVVGETRITSSRTIFSTRIAIPTVV